ncbi:MAG: AraC family transcriptional regulator [Planctomycetota bacterium]
MIDYFAYGQRDYKSKPVQPYARDRWEFQAVLQGTARLWKPDGLDLPRDNTLWVFPPGHRHGWSGDGRRDCRVFVLHTRWVPAELVQLGAEGVLLEAALTNRDRDRLRALATRIRAYEDRPTLRQQLAARHAILELSLLALDQYSQLRLRDQAKGIAFRKAHQAVAWYEENLADGPRVADVAQAVGVSSTHLRRLFLQARQEAPHAAFDRIRLQRADELLTGTDLKLLAIAQMLGFSGVESFHRAYRKGRGCTPGQTRRAAI